MFLQGQVEGIDDDLLERLAEPRHHPAVQLAPPGRRQEDGAVGPRVDLPHALQELPGQRLLVLRRAQPRQILLDLGEKILETGVAPRQSAVGEAGP
jgi:hypothetical protein